MPRAKKALSQNFLNDHGVLARIVETVDPSPTDHILEVGPGRGALTRLMAEQGAQLLAVELDRQLVPILRHEFAGNSNVEVVEADILKTDLPTLLTSRWPGKWKVAANLPYNISSQVLFQFLDHAALFSELVLMLQREVGERIAAPPDCKDYGILSVFCQLHFDISREFIVKPGAFRPVPKVDSVVLKFRALAKPRVEVGDERFFRLVVKAAFSQRRKTLWNCLRSAELGVDEEQLQAALKQAYIEPGRRGETLALAEFARLANTIYSFIKPVKA